MSSYLSTRLILAMLANCGLLELVEAHRGAFSGRDFRTSPNFDGLSPTSAVNRDDDLEKLPPMSAGKELEALRPRRAHRYGYAWRKSTSPGLEEPISKNKSSSIVSMMVPARASNVISAAHQTSQ